MAEFPPDLTESFGNLSQILTADEGIESTLDRIANLSVATIDGCDVASISLVEGGAIRTVGYTDKVAVDIDAIQYETGQGPCLSAIAGLSEPGKAATFEIGSMADDNMWPDFSARARDRGMSSLHAVALLVTEKTLGSLNLYARAPYAFNEIDRHIATVFAAQASVALANAQTLERAQHRVEELMEGYANRDFIGMAKGILMEREHCTEAEAFEMLKHVSQHVHKKLRDVARGVIASSSGPREPTDG